ncbi:MAG: hypothetical protein HQM04_17295 [Magnetococcales bacterium]|nr:hypothetical protein [Magnetococcales bacterium]MBF0116786.1 hypothetical protein [Magnetococcales bacterium]
MDLEHVNKSPLTPITWPLLGSGRNQTILFVCGFLFFAVFIQIMTFVPEQERQFFPVKPLQSLIYLQRSVQFEECFFQDCPALRDIWQQIVQNGKADQGEFGYYFTLYTPLHAWLVMAMKKLTDRSWVDAYLIVKGLGGLVIAVGAAWWLHALFGPVVAGLALLFLAAADARLPEHGYAQVAPGNISMGIAMLIWGVLIRYAAAMGHWLPVAIILPFAMHQLGIGFAGVTLAAYILLRWNALRRQDGWMVLTGLLLIILLLALPYLIEFPVFGLNRFLNLSDSTRRLIDMNHVAQIGVIVARWMEPYRLNGVSVVGMVLFLLGWSLYRRWFVWGIFLLLLGGLCVLSFFTGSQSSEIFGRYWILMSVLLSGILFAFLVLAVLLLRNGLVRVRSCFPARSATRSAGLWQGFAPGAENKWVAGMLGVIVLVLMVQVQLANTRHATFPIEKRLWDLTQRGDYAFDPTQPARLHQADRPCDKVLYVNAHGPYANEGQQIAVMAYLMEKAMQCGALLYTSALYPPDSPGRRFLENNLQTVTHIVFQNVAHTSSRPISLREGQPRLRLWKETPVASWRLLLKNPGAREAHVALRPHEQSSGSEEPLARFTLPAGWEGWAEIRLPSPAGNWYDLLAEAGEEVWLRGLRPAAGEAVAGDLMWPWDQGVELNFRNYRLEGSRRIDDTRWNTRFTVAEMIPELKLPARVVADRGMTVLAVVEPLSLQEAK